MYTHRHTHPKTSWKSEDRPKGPQFPKVSSLQWSTTPSGPHYDSWTSTHIHANTLQISKSHSKSHLNERDKHVCVCGHVWSLLSRFSHQSSECLHVNRRWDTYLCAWVCLPVAMWSLWPQCATGTQTHTHTFSRKYLFPVLTDSQIDSISNLIWQVQTHICTPGGGRVPATVYLSPCLSVRHTRMHIHRTENPIGIQIH